MLQQTNVSIYLYFLLPNTIGKIVGLHEWNNVYKEVDSDILCKNKDVYYQTNVNNSSYEYNHLYRPLYTGLAQHDFNNITIQEWHEHMFKK